MIYISDLSTSYLNEITIPETTSVVGGLGIVGSFNIKISDVDIVQFNIESFYSQNIVGSVNTFQ
jgi:hypothetical protein